MNAAKIRLDRLSPGRGDSHSSFWEESAFRLLFDLILFLSPSSDQSETAEGLQARNVMPQRSTAYYFGQGSTAKTMICFVMRCSRSGFLWHDLPASCIGRHWLASINHRVSRPPAQYQHTSITHCASRSSFSTCRPSHTGRG